MPLSPNEQTKIEWTTAIPVWVKKIIERLNGEPDVLVDALATANRKLSVAEARVRRLEDRINFMLEVFQSAARGESEIAKAIAGATNSWLTS